MAEGGDDGEKSFEPTPQKIEDARRKGDVATSNDLAGAAAYLGLLAALLISGQSGAIGAGGDLSFFLREADQLTGHLLGPGGSALALALLGETLGHLAPFFLIPFTLVLAAYLGQRSFTFAPTKVEPKLERISPIQGAKNKFGVTGLVEFAKTTVKMSAITIALTFYIISDLDRMIGALNATPAAVPALMMEIGAGLLTVIAIIAVALGLADLIWKRFDHARKLRMTFQELKEETKRSEGDPHIKQQRRQRAEEIATNRMVAEVPRSDVVIVNPTHYAVALKWSRAPGSAPVCVAKGVDEVALRIREAAEEANVPIHSDPPTARAIHGAVEIGREIEPDHYAAVAAAIRFAETMRARARERDG